jgi:benzoate membrane transport protein
VPGALTAAVAAIVVSGTERGLPADSLQPVLELTPPGFTVPALVGLALPLFLVTMAGQNVPGAAVLATFGTSHRCAACC